MNHRNEQPKINPEPPPSAKLAEDLSALYTTRTHVPREVDESVMRMARERLARRGERAPAWRWAIAGAAACCLLVALLMVHTAGRPALHAARAPATAAPSREDLDGNGRVDILDAFALARRLEAAEPLRAEWDVNGDGSVDGADVDRIALAAVSLRRRSLQ